MPFSFYFPTQNGWPTDSVPSNRLNSLKLAGQYTFLVATEAKISLALGYIHEFDLTEFKHYYRTAIYQGNTFKPFVVAAKRWRQNWHTLIYAGPIFTQHYNHPSLQTRVEVNSNIHYMIEGTRNFIGVEFNKSVSSNDFDMTIRPQIRVGLAHNLLIGIVGGIPIDRESQRLSASMRVIYEPGVRLHR